MIVKLPITDKVFLQERRSYIIENCDSIISISHQSGFSYYEFLDDNEALLFTLKFYENTESISV